MAKYLSSYVHACNAQIFWVVFLISYFLYFRFYELLLKRLKLFHEFVFLPVHQLRYVCMICRIVDAWFLKAWRLTHFFTSRHNNSQRRSLQEKQRWIPRHIKNCSKLRNNTVASVFVPLILSAPYYTILHIYVIKIYDPQQSITVHTAHAWACTQQKRKEITMWIYPIIIAIIMVILSTRFFFFLNQSRLSYNIKMDFFRNKCFIAGLP